MVSSRVSPAVRLLLICFAIGSAVVALASAQNPPASFHGRIVDPDTGQTINEEVTIVLTKEGASSSSRRVIEVQGEFLVPDLVAGRYLMQFRYKGIETSTPRFVQVSAFSAPAPADIYLRLPGEISGVIVDNEGAPVQGSHVMLVTVEYLAGQALYTASGGKNTDDRGYFSLSTRVEPGLSYYILVLPPLENRPNLTGTPSLSALWYPGRPGVAEPFVIRSSERKRVDVMMEKRETRCVNGTLTKNGRPASLNFEIAIPEVAGYRSSTGGTQGVIFRGESDVSGHFQACGLWPGEFLLAAGMSKESFAIPQNIGRQEADPHYGHAILSIKDSDLHDVTLNAQSPVTLNAEIRLDSAQAPAQLYRLYINPLSRVAFENQPFMGQYKNVNAPSQFEISLLPSTDYMIGLGYLEGTSDAYIKEVACGGGVRRDSLQLRDTDCGLRITIGTDMGKLIATVVDKDNNNDLSSLVCVYPIAAVSREEIASTGTCSSSEPGTTSISMSLRPDRYTAVVMPQETVDWAEYILSNRGQVSLFDIPARSTVRMTLKSVSAH